MGRKRHQHKDTTVSLHPLSFGEAMTVLSHVSKHGDSQVVESDNTKEAVPESETSARQNAPHPESSDD